MSIQNPARGERPRLQHGLGGKVAWFSQRSHSRNSHVGTFVALRRLGSMASETQETQG